MTRKRVGRNLSYFYEEECPVCSGKGKIKSSESLAFEIIREIKQVANEKDISKIYIRARREVINLIKDSYFDMLSEYLNLRKKEFILEEKDIWNYEITLGK